MEWLILFVNLTGLTDIQDNGKATLGVSARVLPEIIGMYIDKLNKEDTHSHPSTPLHRRRRHRQLSMVAPSNKLGVYMEQKAEDAYTHAYDQLI